VRRRSPAAALIATVLTLAACGPTPIVSPAPVASPTPSTSPTATPSPADSATASANGSAAAANRVDQGLLDVLPGDVEGQALRPDEEAAGDIVTGGDLPAEVDAIGVGLYIGSASTSDDLAIANVVRLRSGVFTDAWFRSWRDTYNMGACEVAGGVSTGAAEAEIDGRTVYIGRCQGGVRVYHVRLADPDRVVSITSVGDGRYGERIVEGLTE
jgi:hypothetical protein